jgi:hypothetical protein
VSPGRLEPEFKRQALTYRLQVPLVTQELAIDASAMPGVEVSIERASLERAGRWTAPLAVAGDTSVRVALRAASGTRNEYVIDVTRSRQEAYLKASHARAGDSLGIVVAAYADTIVVGAPFEGSGSASVTDMKQMPQSGAAYVFVRDGDQWRQQAYLKSSRIVTNDLFGASVAIWGDRIAVGGLGHDIFTALGTGVRDGSVHVFVRQGETWSLEERVVSANAVNSGDAFGFAVALREDAMVVGAPLEDDGGLRSGAAYVFKRSDAHWQQQQRFKAQSPQAESRFGSTVAFDGATLALGASQEDAAGSRRAGAVYVYTRDAAGWTLLQRLMAPVVRTMAQFGYALAVQDDLLLASAPHNALEDMSGRSGEVHVFQRHGAEYSALMQLAAPAPAVGDYYGNSLALHGSTLVVGACGEYSTSGTSESRSMPGAAYVYARTDQGFTHFADLAATSGRAQDNYGYAVAVTDGFVAITAPKEDGAPGKLESSANVDSGALYVVR